MPQPFCFSPSRCIIELSYLCNLRCKTCNIWQKPKFENSRELSTENWKTVQKGLSQAGITRVTYLGGEPFLNKSLLGLARNAKENNISPAVVTNGTLIDNDTAQELVNERVFDIIIFSIDGPQDVHDHIRGVKGTFQKAVTAIDILQKTKKKQKKKLPKIYIYTTLSSLNFNSIDEIALLAQKYDVNALKFLSVSCVSEDVINKTNELFDKKAIRGHSYGIPDDLRLPSEQLLRIRQRLAKVRERAKKIGLKLFIEEKLINDNSAGVCGFLGHDFVISAAGDVYPCPMLPDLQIGNVLKTNVGEMLSDKAVLNKMEKVNELSNNKMLAVCKECCVEKL
jgi:radical SAM protein with 4Fe4S-binding SPASM domain